MHRTRLFPGVSVRRQNIEAPFNGLARAAGGVS